MAETQAVQEVTEGTSVETPDGSKVSESVAGHKRVMIHFEHFLIACALYEELWDKVGMERFRNSCKVES